jgi:hypothetical protein
LLSQGTMKSRFLLLDANVVIVAHADGYWQALLNQFKLALPSVVYHKEAQFFHTKNARGIQITLKPTKDSGSITILEATGAEISRIKARLNDDFFQSLGEGELEALALMNSGNHDDYLFCSGDIPANRAMGVLDLATACVSLEEVLQNGSIKKSVAPHFTIKALSRALADGLSGKSIYEKAK